MVELNDFHCIAVELLDLTFDEFHIFRCHHLLLALELLELLATKLELAVGELLVKWKLLVKWELLIKWVLLVKWVLLEWELLAESWEKEWELLLGKWESSMLERGVLVTLGESAKSATESVEVVR